MDLQTAAWRIPSERMKAGRAVVTSRDGHTGTRQRPVQSGRLVLPGPSRASRQMHATTLARLYGDRCTLHGIRSSFRDWATEQTSVSHAVAEAVLARTR